MGLNETNGDRPLCYCFGHSAATIKGELQTKGESGAIQDIRAKMKEPCCPVPQQEILQAIEVAGFSGMIVKEQ